MASFSATLHLDGNVYSLAWCSYSFHQHIDYRGRPRSKVRKGPIYVNLYATDETGALVAWSVNDWKTLSGRIVFSRPDSEAALKHLWFANAFCTGCTEAFDSTGTTGQASLQLHITISPEDMGEEAGNGEGWVVPLAREHTFVSGTNGQVGLGALIEDFWNDINDNYITDKRKLATIKQALKDQKQMLLEKQAALKRWGEADIDCFGNTFGRFLPKDRELVQGRVNQQLKLVDEFLKNDSYKQRFFASSDEGSIAHVYGYDTDHEIYLSNSYWELPAKERAGVLGHEMTHYSDKAGLNDYGKYGYGVGECRNLARRQPEMALDNADNFRFYLQGDLCK